MYFLSLFRCIIYREQASVDRHATRPVDNRRAPWLEFVHSSLGDKGEEDRLSTYIDTYNFANYRPRYSFVSRLLTSPSCPAASGAPSRGFSLNAELPMYIYFLYGHARMINPWAMERARMSVCIIVIGHSGSVFDRRETRLIKESGALRFLIQLYRAF